MPAYRREKKARELLGPYLQLRLDQAATGQLTRSDLLQWLIDQSPGDERDVIHLVQALFAVNAAVQSATTFLIANALFVLARDSKQYTPELRAEAQKHLGGSGISKSALDNLVSMDRFMHESARMNNAFLLTAERVAMDDFTFSDGTFIPKGTTLAVPQMALHRDQDFWSEPAAFAPSRFERNTSEQCDTGEDRDRSSQLSDTNDARYVHFGHGKHTWYVAVNDVLSHTKN